ncbi:MAG: L-lysine 6-transaminase [Thermoanaerobaculia bacterium]|nr:L-lysine 6-transaminase [Thermoanaerobaculia bacterium]
MTTDPTTPSAIRPSEVHDRLAAHILADGLDIVLDLTESRGSRIRDARRGREILDLFGCFSTIPIGYNHPRLFEPEFERRLLAAAINKPSNSDLYTVEMADFVDAFARTLPQSFRSHLFFISGGALAVENALKAAFDWKRQLNDRAGRGVRGEQVIHFEQAFHGRSGYTLSLTNTDRRKTRYFPKFSWPRIPNPHLSFPLTDEVLERVEAAEAAAIEAIEQAIVEHRHDIAALIVEPIQGEGGDNHFRREFLAALRELADENEFLLVFDEVQTGFGTTGSWWCFEQLGVEPDIFAFGKKTQICGIAATRRLDEIDSVFAVSSRINSTWGGNLVDMVRCQRIIEVIEEEDLLTNAQRVGEEILVRLRAWEETYDGRVSNSRGRGLFVAFDLPTHEERERLLRLMYEADVLGLRSGQRAIRFRPALNLSSDDAREGLHRIERALDRLYGS